MIIVDCRLDHPILREALDRVPEMRVIDERSDAIDDERVRALFWAEGGDFEAFEDALEDDPTVATPSRVIPLGDRRLYQTELVGEGLQTSVYPLVVEEGGVIQKFAATHEGWECRIAFPDRTAFERFREFCRDNRIGIELRRLYEEQTPAAPSEYDLTAAQRETLVAAIDRGYFEIPRECTLAELGAHLDVSETAASERLRRAVKALVTQTVSPDGVDT